MQTIESLIVSQEIHSDKQKILVLGASSGIAEEVIKEQISRARKTGQNLELFLCSRTISKIASTKKLAKDAGFTVYEKTVDAFSASSKTALLLSLEDLSWYPDIIILAWGELVRSDSSCEEKVIDRMLRLNHVLSISWLVDLQKMLARHFKSSHFVVLGSIAGDRLRRKLYHYCLSKQRLEQSIQTLRSDFAIAGSRILLVKPGPVLTAMTADLNEVPLMAKAETVARQICNGIGTNKTSIYTPRKWFLISKILKLIPEFLWKKMDI
jgi:decaprenylphospho-beta-D-erythro-pentofuranosid-2-ulose 2-reductase